MFLCLRVFSLHYSQHGTQRQLFFCRRSIRRCRRSAQKCAWHSPTGCGVLIVSIVGMSPFSWQYQNLCFLSLAFITDWKVVRWIAINNFLISNSICQTKESWVITQSLTMPGRSSQSSIADGGWTGADRDPPFEMGWTGSAEASVI